MRAITVAVVAAGLIALGWVSTPPANPAATPPPHLQGADAAVLAAPSLAIDPDDDEDETRPRRSRRSTQD